MNRRLRIYLLVILVLGQLFIHNQYHRYRLNIDLFYLIVFYVSIKLGFYKGIIAATILGLLTDYLSMGVMGVFSFSRVLASYFVNEVSRFIDLRKNVFIFLFILVSLFFSNLVAFLFFYFIFKFQISNSLLFLQPLLTAMTGTVLLLSAKMKNMLHVY